MADTVLVGGINYSTDDITNLNGAAIAAGSAQTQRMKMQYGDDNSARDISPLFPMPIYGKVGSAGSSTGTATAVVPTAAAATLLAANINRNGFAVTNDSNVDVLLLLASGTVSSTTYTVRVVAGAYYEAPGTNTIWQGAITLIGMVGTTATAATTGACRVTEWAP